MLRVECRKDITYAPAIPAEGWQRCADCYRVHLSVDQDLQNVSYLQMECRSFWTKKF